MREVCLVGTAAMFRGARDNPDSDVRAYLHIAKFAAELAMILESTEAHRCWGVHPSFRSELA
jgi:hypothetical protein